MKEINIIKGDIEAQRDEYRDVEDLWIATESGDVSLSDLQTHLAELFEQYEGKTITLIVKVEE